MESARTKSAAVAKVDDLSTLRDAGVRELRERARALYKGLILRSPMDLHDIWNWAGQELNVPKDEFRVDDLDREQYVAFVWAASRKVEEYVERGKWSREPREDRELPWDEP